MILSKSAALVPLPFDKPPIVIVFHPLVKFKATVEAMMMPL